MKGEIIIWNEAVQHKFCMFDVCIELAMPFELPHVSIAVWIASKNGRGSGQSTALTTLQQQSSLVGQYRCKN